MGGRMLRGISMVAATAMAVAFVESAVGATYFGSGNVFALAVADSSVGVNQDYFVLDNTAALGTCAKQGDGRVVLKLRDDAKADRQLQLLQMSLTQYKKITVEVDDTVLSPDGYCLVRYMGLSQYP